MLRSAQLSINDLPPAYFPDDFLPLGLWGLHAFLSMEDATVERRFSRMAASARHKAHDPIWAPIACRSLRPTEAPPETKEANSSLGRTTVAPLPPTPDAISQRYRNRISRPVSRFPSIHYFSF